MAPENESGNQYRLFFDALGVAAFVAEKDMTVSFVNSEMEELSGYTREEMEGKIKWTAFVSEKDLDDVLSYYKTRQGKKGGTQDGCEFRFIHKSGAEKNVLFTMKAAGDEGRSVVSVADISACRQKEKTLEEHEIRYREILFNIEDGYYETDLAGNFLFYNDSLCRLLGYSRDELKTVSYREFYKNPKEVFETYNRVYRTGKPEKAAGWPAVTCDGREIILEVSVSLQRDREGTVTGFSGVARDITERKWAETALQETETYNRALLEAIPDLIFILDKNGYFIDYNAPDKSKLFLPPETFLHKHVSHVLSPELADITLENLSQLIHSGQPQTYEYRAEKGGAQQSYESRLVMCGEDKALAIIRDITDRKRTENELKESEDKFRVLAESSPFAIMIYQDDYYVYVNPAGEQITGYSREELYDMRFWEFIHPDYRSAVKERGRQRQAGQSIISSYDFKLINKSGEERWCTLTGSTTYYRGRPAGFISVIDITDRKKTEEALRESEERYRGILITMEEGYYEVDLSGNIIFCNQSAARFMGYEIDELLGTNFRQLCNEPEKVYHKYNKVFKTGEPEYALTLEIIRKDGAVVYGEVSVAPLKNKEGKVTGFRGIVRDITERYRFEEQLKYISLHDQLTDLYNRAYFENELNRLGESREYPVTIISADLDGLKLVNDTLGHDKGDELLAACAGVLQNSLRTSDIIARVGGDEFAAILPRTDRKTGEIIVNRIHAAIKSYNSKQSENFNLSVSIGFATADDDNKSLKETFKEADDLMYRDKLSKGIDARSQIIHTLMAALGERDFISQGHTRRLEELSIKVGNEINVSKKQLSNLALLAQMHDIGKVAIPDRILFKEGPLTDEERRIMQQHADKGYRIALYSTDLSGIADLILKHHERWAGDGYPMGISGEEIPVECRILAVADAYDAMISDRPYRKAMSKEEAAAELKRCAGTQFDPEIVKTFLAIL